MKNDLVTVHPLQNEKEVNRKNYSCIVIWTFHNDEDNYNYNLIHDALKDFEPIDQSTMGSENVDPQIIYNHLLSLEFHQKEGDFIKIISSNGNEQIFSYDANKQIIRLIYLSNYNSSKNKD